MLSQQTRPLLQELRAVFASQNEHTKQGKEILYILKNRETETRLAGLHKSRSGAVGPERVHV